MATGNTNDRKREETARPNAGGDTSRHAGKGDISQPSAGITLHEDKAAYDQKCGRAGLSQPSQGYVNHPEKAASRGENTEREYLADPDGGVGPIPKENLHLDKQKKHRDRDRHVEPKPKGDSDSSGRSFKSTKVD